MTTARRAAPVVLAGVLALAACGSERAPAGEPGDPKGPVGLSTLCPSNVPQYGAVPPTGEPSAAARPSGPPTPLPVPSSSDGEVKITGLYAWGPDSGCGSDFSADFEVTNDGTEAATYTVTLGFLSSSGGVLDNVERTVASVGPGRTVQGTVVMGESLGASADVSGATVVKVRSVPVDEASSASGPCPASGIHVYADQGDAALGLRAVGLHLVNCGSTPYELGGYPQVELLDEDHDSVEGVRILQGTDEISTGLGDSTPGTLVLRPGEAAQASLAWRNTTEAGDPVNAPYARVRAKPGADPVTVIPEFDLGTTGKLGVGAWTKDETVPAATSSPVS